MLVSFDMRSTSIRSERAPPPSPFGSAPENYSLDYSFNLMILFYLIMTSRHILSLQSVMHCHVSKPTDLWGRILERVKILIFEIIVVFTIISNIKILSLRLKGLAQAKIIKKSVILFRVLNMTI